ncbi:MAG: AMP-binding protein [Eubacterium sp.]|nr:AMP-binding protein [Eubacterium sp.]
MNDKKYDGVYYKFRKVEDLKELICTSAEKFADNDAYLQKNKETGRFEPVKYSEVKSDMDALGTKLIDMGLSGKKIAVIGETSYSWILTYFTVVCGVGVIVPLDKNLPAGELLGLIERSGAEAIVYSEKCRKNIAGLFDDPKSIRYLISMEKSSSSGSQAPDDAAEAEGTDKADKAEELSLPDLLEQGRDLLDQGSTVYTDVDVDPDQMSTLLFTSGTTGAAKGVMLSHRNLASNCMQLSMLFKIPEPGIVLSILPIHHVYEMTCDILTTFYQGKTIAICEGIKYIQKNMEEVHANVMLGVPLVFEKMYKGMWKQAKRRGEDQKLRRAIDLSKALKLYNNKTIIRRLFKAIHNSFGGAMQAFVVGGAAADPYIIEEFEAMGIPMIQGYGMSECSPIICLNSDRYRKADSVGKPVPGIKLRVVDQDEDGIGEIIVKGPSVMMGYYENQEATDEVLRNGWLHTGDLGYIDEDGFVHITGRAKTVIVTKGGKNIFPEEVEAVLLESELVQEVIVHGVTDERVGNVMITADIYPNYEQLKSEHGDLGESGIYHFYKDLVEDFNRKLPPYKQVKRVNIRKEPFIKTTTGKVKRFGNKLGGDPEAGGNMDEHEKKRLEESRARELVEQIRKSKDGFIAASDIHPVTDIKDLIYTSCGRFENRKAFIRKFELLSEDGDKADAAAGAHAEEAGAGQEKKYSEVTYKELLADMDGLGTAMVNMDLGGSNVAIIGRNGYKWQMSYLAVVSGVGTVVPIEYDLPLEELERRLNEAEVRVAIFESTLRHTFTAIRDSGSTPLEVLIEYDYNADEKNDQPEETETAAAETAPAQEYVKAPAGSVYKWEELIETGKHSVSQGDRQYIDRHISGDDVAAIVYTSGETGPARSVAITQANICYGVMSAAASVNIGPSDIVYSSLPAHIMYEITCGLLLPLYRGAAVVSSARGAYTGAGRVHRSRASETASAAAMCSEMRDTSPTVLVMTPADIRIIRQMFADTVEERRGSAAIYTIMNANKITSTIGINIVRPFAQASRDVVGGKVRMIITGGSKVDKEAMEELRVFGITALQSYWLTECSTIAAIDPSDKELVRIGSCGHLVPGLQVKVINKDRDGIGEICFKGENVMKGYYKDEEATAAAITDGWLHTGDLGYVDDDNYIYITGRK